MLGGGLPARHAVRGFCGEGRASEPGDPCCRLQGRIKSLHSTARKMARKRVALQQVFDARALRVVVDDQRGARLQQVRARSGTAPVCTLFCEACDGSLPVPGDALHTSCGASTSAAMVVAQAAACTACSQCFGETSAHPNPKPRGFTSGVLLRVQAIEACYEIVPAVHRLWRPIRGEYDDYIFNPKASGYQSLHSAVIGMHALHVCPSSPST